jgi:hypothetical protein
VPCPFRALCEKGRVMGIMVHFMNELAAGVSKKSHAGRRLWNLTVQKTKGEALGYSNSGCAPAIERLSLSPCSSVI